MRYRLWIARKPMLLPPKRAISIFRPDVAFRLQPQEEFLGGFFGGQTRLCRSRSRSA
jgi:hypothetical protein